MFRIEHRLAAGKRPQQVGLRIADINARRSDAVLAPVQGQHSGHSRKRAFRRRVGGRMRPRYLRCDGAVDQDPAAVVLHAVKCLASTQEGANHIGVDNHAEVGDIGVAELSRSAGQTRVQNHCVQAASMRLCLGKHLGYLGFIGDIALRIGDVVAFSCGVRKCVDTPAADMYVPARSGESQGNFATNPASAAGYYYRLIHEHHY